MFMLPRASRPWLHVACILATLAGFAGPTRAQPAPTGTPDDQASAIYGRAFAGGGNTASLTAALGEVDALLAANPTHALGHYVRGTLLSALDQPVDALAAYDAAIAADPGLAEAQYNAGVVLGGMGREAEAADRFDRATAIDSGMLDAWYNGGQARYNLRDYAGSLARWSSARLLAPDDFEVVKKVLQAQNALGQWVEAAATRDDLYRIWRTNPDPYVRGMTDYVFDQFAVGDEWVFAFETFEPSGDLYNVYTFDCTQAGNIVRSVRIESSAVIREMGQPYILGVQEGDRHTTLPIGFDALPDYATLRPMIIEIVGQLQRGELVGGASSAPSP